MSEREGSRLARALLDAAEDLKRWEDRCKPDDPRNEREAAARVLGGLIFRAGLLDVRASSEREYQEGQSLMGERFSVPRTSEVRVNLEFIVSTDEGPTVERVLRALTGEKR